MPAEKTARASARKLQYKRISRGGAKTSVRKAKILIQTGDISEASVEIQHAISALDKAAQKGAIHRNNAARRKSRLVLALNKANIEPAKPKRRAKSTKS